MADVFVCETGEVRRDTMYSLPEFMKRTGLKDWAIRTARRGGLRVRYVRNRGFVCGGDWIDYCLASSQDEPQGTQDVEDDDAD